MISKEFRNKNIANVVAWKDGHSILIGSVCASSEGTYYMATCFRTTRLEMYPLLVGIACEAEDAVERCADYVLKEWQRFGY